MIIPDFSREEELLSRGFKDIAGVDEAGRGPLAGPVSAAAVIIDDDASLISGLIKLGLRDSKTLSEKKRERLYDFIAENALSWSVELVSERVIDEINILEATKLAMRRALEGMATVPGYVLIDGNFTLRDFNADQTAIPKADAHIVSVSAAAIMAKVTRDRKMRELDEIYPGYEFGIHKGYGTSRHMELLRKMGPCDAHRRSFEPIKSMIGGDSRA